MISSSEFFSSPLRAGAVLLAILVIGLAGCSSSTSMIPAPGAGSGLADITGDWRFGATGKTLAISAGLVDTAGAISGAATVYGCTTAPVKANVTGTLTSNGDLSLSLAPQGGAGTLFLKAQLAADGKTATSVTLDSLAQSCPAAAGQMLAGQVYAPASGDYTGTFAGSDGDAVPVTATLAQSATPGPGGSYTLSGSVSFPTSPCLATATIDSATSTVTGGALSATYTATVAGQAVRITAAGSADASATHITITSWTISGGTCDSYSGTGTLSD